MNWARCNTCNKIQLFFHNDYKAINEVKCVNCGTGLLPVLIPPTFRKDIEQYGIASVWKRADEQLSNADLITIIGYSFPDADIEAKRLIKRAVAKGKRQPKLVIVDKSPEVRKKVMNIFHDTVNEIEEFNTFEKYCEDLMKKFNNC